MRGSGADILEMRESWNGSVDSPKKDLMLSCNEWHDSPESMNCSRAWEPAAGFPNRNVSLCLKRFPSGRHRYRPSIYFLIAVSGKMPPRFRSAQPSLPQSATSLRRNAARAVKRRKTAGVRVVAPAEDCEPLSHRSHFGCLRGDNLFRQSARQRVFAVDKH